MKRRDDASAIDVTLEGEDLVVICLPEGPAPRVTESTRLTRAELDVVRGVLDGLSDREIAARRGVSARTIANQLASIYDKLGVSGRSQLVARLLDA